MTYDYTKPRQPITAMYKSPGPCHALPTLTGAVGHDPRSTLSKGPSWGLGGRLERNVRDCSPGPVHYPDPRVTKRGADGSPRFSLYGRVREISMYQAPPPGTYSPENAGPSAYHQAPLYSFGFRTSLKTADTNPAPNTYSLPTLLGRTVESTRRSGPSITQKGRVGAGGFSEDLQKTPGPGTYPVADPNSYKQRSPLFSIHSRHLMPGDTTVKPGPGTYYPENVVMHKYQSPRPSFGIRHSEFLTPLITDIAD